MSEPTPANPVQTVDYASPSTPPARNAPLGAIAGRGVAFMTAVTLLSRVLGVVQQIALAWLLLPTDFGKFALAMTAGIVGGIIAKPGIEDFLIQRGRRMRIWENEAFWLSASLGLLGSIVLWVSGWIGAWAYGEPAVLHVLLIFSINTFALSLTTVPACRLSTDLRFARTAWLSTIVAVLAPVVVVALAWLGFGVYALALSAVIVAVVSLLLAWNVAPARIRPRFHIRRWRFILAPTSLRCGSRFSWAVVANSDYMALGAFATQAIVGTYFYAYSMATQVSRLLGQNLAAILMPSLSSIADDRVRQTEAALRSMRLIAACTTPISLSLAAVAGPLIRLIAPDRFAGAIPLIQILSFATVTNAGFSAAHSLILARGEFAREMKLAWLSMLGCLATSFLFAFLGGAIGAAWGVLVYSWIDQSIRVRLFVGPAVTVMSLAGHYAKPVLCSVIAYFVLASLLERFAPERHIWYAIECAAVLSLGTVAYACLMWLVDRAVVIDLYTRARKMIK